MDRRYHQALARGLGTVRSRRQVLGAATKGAIGGLGAALTTRGLAPGTSAQDSPCAQPTCPPVAEPFVRRNVYDLSDEQIASLRRGVWVMKQRRPTDVTSWAFQANLHAVPVLMPEPTWCQHRSWFFFPWHRMYLYWFERILRDASGDPTLTLPYWNYSDVVDQQVLPRAFGDSLDASGNPNPLFESRRAPGINDGSVPLTDETVAYGPSLRDYKEFFSETDPPTASFGGQKIPSPMNDGPGLGSVEGTPHGGVHVEVGGLTGFTGIRFDNPGVFEYHCSLHPTERGRIEISTTAPPVEDDRVIISIADPESVFDPSDVEVPVGTTVIWLNLSFDLPHSVTATDETFDSDLLEPPGLMYFPQLAARDPIFWLHHANIDRLWERWLALKEGRSNPVEECDWMDVEFPFYREDGSPVSMSAKQVLDTVNCLGYRYDDPATEFDREAPPAVTTTPAAAARRVEVLGETPPDQPIELGLERVTTLVELNAPAEETLTRIARSNATPTPGTFVPQIVLSLDGIRDRGAPGITYGIYVNLPPDVQPDPRGDYFVGVISLFGLLTPMGGGMSRHQARQSFNIARAVRTSQERGQWQGDVTVTFVPRGSVPDAAGASVRESQAPWVIIERITVSGIE